MLPNGSIAYTGDFNQRSSIASNISSRINRWMLAWSLIFAANLPLPLYFGFVATERGGWFGMSVAVVVMWIMGLHACSRNGKFREALCYGGAMTAILQVFPVLHVFAGLVGCSVWGRIIRSGSPAPEGQNFELLMDAFSSPEPLVRELGGCVVTLVTGGILALVAVAIGYFLLWWNDPDKGQRPLITTSTSSFGFDVGREQPYRGE